VTVGAKEVDAARRRLAVTIANEIVANGGLPVSEDNPRYQAAKKKVDDAVAEADTALDPWNND
jgi:hypothetical protein